MIKVFEIKDKKLILLKILVIAFPSYIVAFLTEKIIFVVPTIAMMMMIANAIETANISNRNRLDDEDEDADEDDKTKTDADTLNQENGGS